MTGSSYSLSATQSNTASGGEADNALVPGHPCAETFQEQSPWFAVHLDSAVEVDNVIVNNSTCLTTNTTF